VEFRRLDSAQDPLFAEAFALYEASFPQHEQRTPAMQTVLMTNPLYYFTVIIEDGAFVGILLYWAGSGYTYVEHFAIMPSMRGKAAGSRILESFCERYAPVVLEIDPLIDETAVRREHFYRRIGFKTNGYAHVHPAYQNQFPPHNLLVLSYPQLMNEKEYQIFRRELEETVMQDAPC
jgi:ribosomal protein S18 acetylase RimI-like enzyme